jgi:glycosyltransferase involved in cell wall biosynthesis
VLVRIAIASDHWYPHVDGIVVTIDHTLRELRTLGHDTCLVSASDFPSIAALWHGDDRIVLAWYPRIRKCLDAFKPDHVHISTQGLLGLAARFWCRRHNVGYSTAFHTQFPECVEVRHGIPTRFLYPYFRWFHGPKAPMLVPTRAMQGHLRARGFLNPTVWGRGVDHQRFAPRLQQWTKYRRPLYLYVGRVSAEKNVETFLYCDVGEGTKLVVGDGPLRAVLERRHPAVRFLGPKYGEALVECYAEANVVAFPSLVDTFGLVVVEALACGTPVACFPAPQLRELFEGGGVVFGADMGLACQTALTIPRSRCREHAMAFSWRACAEQLVAVAARELLARTSASEQRL